MCCSLTYENILAENMVEKYVYQSNGSTKKITLTEHEKAIFQSL